MSKELVGGGGRVRGSNELHQERWGKRMGIESKGETKRWQVWKGGMVSLKVS